MKFTIDTTTKEISILQPINLFDLFEIIQKMFSNDAWKEYKIIPNYAGSGYWYSQPYIQPYTVTSGTQLPPNPISIGNAGQHNFSNGTMTGCNSNLEVLKNSGWLTTEQKIKLDTLIDANPEEQLDQIKSIMSEDN